MKKLLLRYRTPLLVAALFLAPLVVYRAHVSDPGRANPLDRIVLGVTSPLERLLSRATVVVSDRWYRYVDLAGARAQNIALEQRLSKMEKVVAEAEALAEENRRLRRALALRERNPSLELLPSSVVAIGPSPLAEGVRIDRGLVHGVRRGMAVITERGLVGRVQRTGYHTADIVLITDEHVELQVVVSRSGVRGLMRGSPQVPGEPLRLQHLGRTDDVRVGDRVLSSGLAGVFPRGVPVGVISRAGMVAHEQEPYVVVQPEVALERLDQVLVVLSGGDRGEPLVTPPAVLPSELSRSSSAALARGSVRTATLAMGTR